MQEVTGKIKISQQTAKKTINNISDFKKAIEKNIQEDTSKLLETILFGAISLYASDIHLEPKEDNVRLRIRLDGMLHDVLFFQKETYHFLVSRIKLLAGLKLNIHDKPQDGSFSIVLPNKEIEIRTSSLPADWGESIVMRILNPESLRSVEDLGLRGDLLKTLDKEIKKPNGMIIVTGPTGSGKTTTLYAFLKKIQNPEIKIITIEDPIEYRLKGISQTEVHPEKGYDFPNGLRSIVRQDPDVILIGEIRDLETAQIAIQAALTGHLVLSTLHTNDAAGAIPRLISLGAKPANIGPAINVIIAQRLVRRVCKKCVSLKPASQEELALIKNDLSKVPKKIKLPKIKNDILLPHPVGCKYCNFTGYKGRIGIFEAIVVDEDLQDLILKNPSIHEIKKMAQAKGLVTMRQDGLIKVIQQITTIEEVERAAG